MVKVPIEGTIAAMTEGEAGPIFDVFRKGDGMGHTKPNISQRHGSYLPDSKVSSHTCQSCEQPSEVSGCVLKYLESP